MHHRSQVVAAALVTLLLAGASTARAQPITRPSYFYILSRTPPADASAERLPASARAPYREVLSIRRRAHEAVRTRSGADRANELKRLERLDDAAHGRLEAALGAAAPDLTPEAWLVYAEARFRAAALRYMQAVEEMEEHGTAQIEGPDFGEVIALYRYVAASAEPRLAAITRYLEGYCLLEMGRYAEAAIAFRIAAVDAPAPLRAELFLRLGEEAFDEGRFAEAVGWYARVDPTADEHLHALAQYKRVWALAKLERWADAVAARSAVPAASEPELRTDLDQLLLQRPSR